MTNQLAFRIAAAAGLLAVALGAFGAHGLKPILIEHQSLGLWEKAVFYHFAHALMLIWLAGSVPLAKGPWFCFFAGILVFSGSLYLLAVTGFRWLGGITPIGGVGFMAGWCWLMVRPRVEARGPAKLN